MSDLVSTLCILFMHILQTLIYAADGVTVAKYTGSFAEALDDRAQAMNDLDAIEVKSSSAPITSPNADLVTAYEQNPSQPDCNVLNIGKKKLSKKEKLKKLVDSFGNKIRKLKKEASANSVSKEPLTHPNSDPVLKKKSDKRITSENDISKKSVKKLLKKSKERAARDGDCANNTNERPASSKDSLNDKVDKKTKLKKKTKKLLKEGAIIEAEKKRSMALKGVPQTSVDKVQMKVNDTAQTKKKKKKEKQLKDEFMVDTIGTSKPDSVSFKASCKEVVVLSDDTAASGKRSATESPDPCTLEVPVASEAMSHDARTQRAPVASESAAIELIDLTLQSQRPANVAKKRKMVREVVYVESDSSGDVILVDDDKCKRVKITDSESELSDLDSQSSRVNIAVNVTTPVGLSSAVKQPGLERVLQSLGGRYCFV